MVHVSNFRPVKRVTAVVEVFARVRKQLPSRLLMVGDGPDLAEAIRLTRSLGVHKHVEFLGEQDRVLPVLSASDLFLLPSAQESFGLAALEAMSCGVPVVASRVGGLPEVVADGVTGFVCEADDLDGMAARSVRILTDAALRSTIGQAAAADVHRRFCTETIVPQYEAYYENVLRGIRQP
jgi:N-acetyl-alpha-D-glucosaminyl L-malate synthase BshA